MAHPILSGPPSANRLNQPRIVHFGGIDPRAHRMGLHPCRIVGLERLPGFDNGPVQPVVVVSSAQNRRHARRHSRPSARNSRHERIGRNEDHRTALDDIVAVRHRSIPHPPPFRTPTGSAAAKNKVAGNSHASAATHRSPWPAVCSAVRSTRACDRFSSVPAPRYPYTPWANPWVCPPPTRESSPQRSMVPSVCPSCNPQRGNVLLRRDVELGRKFPPALCRQELAFRGRLVRKCISSEHGLEVSAIPPPQAVTDFWSCNLSQRRRGVSGAGPQGPPGFEQCARDSSGPLGLSRIVGHQVLPDFDFHMRQAPRLAMVRNAVVGFIAHEIRLIVRDYQALFPGAARRAPVRRSAGPGCTATAACISRRAP